MTILTHNGSILKMPNSKILSLPYVVKPETKIFSSSNLVTSIYYNLNWTTFTSNVLGYLHGFIKAGNYLFCSSRSGPLKILKLNMDNFNDYQILEFSGTADFNTAYGPMDKMVYSEAKNRIYGAFGDGSPYDKKITVLELNPDTLAWNIVINETRNPVSGFGPQITCDSTHLYVGTATPNGGSIFKYNLSDYSYVSDISVGNSDSGLHATYKDPYSNDIFTTEFDWTVAADVMKIDTVSMLKTGTLSIPDGKMTDEFAITETHLFVGLEDATNRRIYKINKSNFLDNSYITLPSGVNPCYGLTYDGTWIWGTYSTTPGKLLRLNPSNMSYEVFNMPTGVNSINGLVIDGYRMFVTSWEHPAKITRLKKTDYLS